MIGIFDSGSGGLPVLAEIRRKLPLADVIYLGDIKNAPYGNRSREELGALTAAAVSKLLAEGATRIVSACNSVSASIVLPMLSILGMAPFEIVEMVGPAVKALRKKRKKILLTATPATVASGIYQQGFAVVGKKIESLAIPDLAGAIEFGASEPKIEKIIKKSLRKTSLKNKILLLGCTHYPLARKVFEKVLQGKKVEIFDPATAVAEEVAKKMKEKGKGRLRFLITKDSQFFRQRVREFFGTKNIIIEVL